MRKIIIPVFMGIMTCSIAWAGNLGIGGQGAWIKSADADSSAFFGGGHVRIRLLQWFMVEGAFGYRQEKFLDDTMTVKTIPLTISGMLMLMPGSPIEPYLLFGTGVNFIQVSGAVQDQSTSKLGYHAGAGVQLRTKSFSIFGEYRYLGVKFDVDIGGQQSGFQVNASGSSIRVGITIWF